MMKKNVALFTLGFLVGLSFILVSGASAEKVVTSGQYELIFETIQSNMYPDPVRIMFLFNNKTGEFWRYDEDPGGFWFRPVIFTEPQGTP